MAYLTSDGRLVESRPWSFQIITDFFFGIFGFIILFFRGLFHLDDPTSQGQYGNRSRGGQNPPSWPRRRMGGFFSGSSPAAPPCGGGG